MVIVPKMSYISGLLYYYLVCYKWAATWENRIFAYAKTKPQISCAVTAQLISAFVFATWIVQSLYFLNPNFKPLAIFCDFPARFVWDLVGNPEDRFSDVAALMFHGYRDVHVMFIEYWRCFVGSITGGFRDGISSFNLHAIKTVTDACVQRDWATMCF